MHHGLHLLLVLLNDLHLVSQNIVLVGELLVKRLDSHARFAIRHSYFDIRCVLSDSKVEILDLHLHNVGHVSETAGPRFWILHVRAFIGHTFHYVEVVVIILLKLLLAHLDNARVLAHDLKFHLKGVNVSALHDSTKCVSHDTHQHVEDDELSEDGR